MNTDLRNSSPYVVPAGTTKTFTVTGDVECSGTCSGTVSIGKYTVQFLGDIVLPGTFPDSALTMSDTAAELFNNSFVWSDLWRTVIQGISSTTASSTEQWTNGAFVALSNGGKLQTTSTAVTFSR